MPSSLRRRTLHPMRPSPLHDTPAAAGDVAAAQPGPPHHPPVPAPKKAGQAALDAARALGRKAAAPATLRAYKADWTHYAAWCAAHGFPPVSAAPAIVGAYLASLRDSHAPATVRCRLSAIGTAARRGAGAYQAIQQTLCGQAVTHLG